MAGEDQLDIDGMLERFRERAAAVQQRGLPPVTGPERQQFIEATRTKLVLEISGREPEPRVLPASAQAPRISCTIGEKMWQERWGGYDFR